MLLFIFVAIFYPGIYGYPAVVERVVPSNVESTFGEYSINRDYPFTKPIKTDSGLEYRIGIISDLDKKSKSTEREYTWISVFKTGYLSWLPLKKTVFLNWYRETRLLDTLSQKGRGMELSELVVFDGKLLSFDDKTGMVYIIDKEKVIPWLILVEADGKSSKGT